MQFHLRYMTHRKMVRFWAKRWLTFHKTLIIVLKIVWLQSLFLAWWHGKLCWFQPTYTALSFLIVCMATQLTTTSERLFINMQWPNLFDTYRSNLFNSYFKSRWQAILTWWIFCWAFLIVDSFCLHHSHQIWKNDIRFFIKESLFYKL